MNRPNKFIINTQFPTQKEQGDAIGSIIIPSNVNISAGATASGAATVSIGTAGSISRGQIVSSKSPGNRYATQVITYPYTGTVSGSPAPYQVIAFMWRSGPNSLTFQVLINNPYGATLIGQSGAETISFYSAQIVAPYA
jgi:hypothetical protein